MTEAPQNGRLKCLHCGHMWLARVQHPLRCPRCVSYYWNVARPKRVATRALSPEPTETENTEEILRSADGVAQL